MISNCFIHSLIIYFYFNFVSYISHLCLDSFIVLRETKHHCLIQIPAKRLRFILYSLKTSLFRCFIYSSSRCLFLWNKRKNFCLHGFFQSSLWSLCFIFFTRNILYLCFIHSSSRCVCFILVHEASLSHCLTTFISHVVSCRRRLRIHGGKQDRSIKRFWGIYSALLNARGELHVLYAITPTIIYIHLTCYHIVISHVII